ncbi:hypothetical protein D7X88_17585, partial [bacterium C-53]
SLTHTRFGASWENCCRRRLWHSPNVENTDRSVAGRNGGMQQAQMNETVAKVRQSLRTED